MHFISEASAMSLPLAIDTFPPGYLLTGFLDTIYIPVTASNMNRILTKMIDSHPEVVSYSDYKLIHYELMHHIAS